MLDLLLIAVFVCLLVYWLQSNPFAWKGKGIKWSLPPPFIGNTGKLLVKSWADFWQEFYTSLGDVKVYGFHYFSTPALLIKDPELIKKVLITDAHHFMAREMNVGDVDPTGRGIFFAGGQRWKTHRSKLTPHFTPFKLKQMLPFIKPIIDKFVQEIDQRSESGPVDVHSLAMKLTTDVIISNGFGLKPDSFENPDSFFFSLQRSIISFKTGVRAVANTLSPTLFKVFKLTLIEPNHLKQLDKFVTDVMNDRAKGIGVRPDVMQGFMELYQDFLSKKKNHEEYNERNTLLDFDKETVVGQAITMFIAGSETTGNALTFLLYELALHQEIQDNVRQEINDMLRETCGECDIEHMFKLNYTYNVLQELHRLHTILPFVGRICTSAYNLDGLEIPVGTIISLPIAAIHCDPNIYPDSHKFDPERFSSDKKITQGTFMPFGLGARTCIGMKLAETEILLSLCALLPKYRITRSSKTPVPLPLTGNPTKSPSVPVYLDFKLIK